MNLYELTQEWRYAVEVAINGCDPETGAIPDDIAAIIDSIEQQREQKIENCVYAIRNLNADAMALDAEISRLQAKKKTADNAIERIRQWLCDNMQDGEKVRTSIATVSRRHSESVSITGDVPNDDRYGRTEFVPSKTKIKEALLAGGEIAFAKIIQNPMVVIR